MVQPDGYINLNVAGTIFVKGLTVDQTHDLIVQTVSTRLKDPELNLVLESFTHPYVVVAGQVAKPGQIELKEDMPKTKSQFDTLTWILATLACIAVAGLFHLGKGSLLRITVPGAAFCIALSLYFRRPAAFLGFSLWSCNIRSPEIQPGSEPFSSKKAMARSGLRFGSRDAFMT